MNKKKTRKDEEKLQILCVHNINTTYMIVRISKMLVYVPLWKYIIDGFATTHRTDCIYIKILYFFICFTVRYIYIIDVCF